MIADLEKEWNVTLLERSVGGVKLTSDGTKLLPYAKNVVAEYEKLQMEVDELNGLQSGLIRIGTFSSVATHWLPNIIKAFQKDYPDIDYELLLGDYTEIEEWIAEGRVDCGFLRLPANSDFDTIFLERDRLLAVISENHPLAGCERFPVKALCGEQSSAGRVRKIPCKSALRRTVYAARKGCKGGDIRSFREKRIDAECEIHDLGRLCGNVDG